MVRARVPPAASNLDHQSEPREHDVVPTPDVGEHSAIDEEPKAATMKFAPERHLWLGVPSTLVLHAPSDVFRRRVRHQIDANVVSYSFAMRVIIMS